MYLVEPSVVPVVSHSIHKKIEHCGRICYKSKSDNTEEGARNFVEKIMKRGHLSVLEHYRMRVKFNSFSDMQKYGELRQLILNSSSRRYLDTVDSVNPTEGKIAAYDSITGNARAFLEFIISHTDDGKYPKHPTVMFLSNILHDQVSDVIFPCFRDYNISDHNITVTEDPNYMTVHIVTDRGVLCELTRHRRMSFSVESTRYCNYVKKGLAFCLPRPFEYADILEDLYVNREDITDAMIDKKNGIVVNNILNIMKSTETAYKLAIESGQSPQEARMLLPHMLKTEIIMSGPMHEWEHVLRLRCAPDAHPQCKYIAEKLCNIVN